MYDWVSCLEFFVDETWMWFGKVEAMLRHEPELVGSLFGVGNRALFRPPFASRGFPAGASLDFRLWIDDAVSSGARVVDSSWVSVRELRAIEWEEEALGVDPRIYKYQRAQDGSEILMGIATDYEELGALGMGGPDAAGVWIIGDAVYRRQRWRRSALLEDSDFPALMDVCDVLARRYGVSNVRWVVAFLE